MSEQPPPPVTTADQSKPDNHNPNPPDSHSTDYAPYPKLDPNDVAPAPDPMLNQQAPHGGAATSMPPESNPYVSADPTHVSTSTTKNTMETVKDVIGKFGKRAAEATTKAQDLAGNMWQHRVRSSTTSFFKWNFLAPVKTSPNIADAAVSRIAQQGKVLAEGGYEKVFRQTFETLPEELLRKWYACYLSTSSGPVMGTLYLSTTKLAFCSDNPLSYKVGEKTEWSYYKVVLPLHQLKAVNPSTSKINPAEKYIQVISVDNHEFWFMGFVHYESAVKNLQEVLQVQAHSNS